MQSPSHSSSHPATSQPSFLIPDLNHPAFEHLLTSQGALLFDFDGVIVDSEPLHYRTLAKACEDINLSLHSQEHGFFDEQSYVGFADRDAYALLCARTKRTPDPAEFEALSQRKWAITQNEIREGRLHAYEATIAIIHHLHGKVPLAICSGARRREILYILDHLGLTDRFVGVVSADDVKDSKPAPESYLKGAAMVGKDPATCLAIEDSDKGVRAAKAAGVATLAVGHSMGPERLTLANWFIKSTATLLVSK